MACLSTPHDFYLYFYVPNPHLFSIFGICLGQMSHPAVVSRPWLYWFCQWLPSCLLLVHALCRKSLLHSYVQIPLYNHLSKPPFSKGLMIFLSYVQQCWRKACNYVSYSKFYFSNMIFLLEMNCAPTSRSLSRNSLLELSPVVWVLVFLQRALMNSTQICIIDMDSLQSVK